MRHGRPRPAPRPARGPDPRATRACLQPSAGNRATVQALRGDVVVQRALSVPQAETIATPARRRDVRPRDGRGGDLRRAVRSHRPPTTSAITEAYAHLELGDADDLDADLADELTESEMAKVSAQLERDPARPTTLAAGEQAGAPAWSGRRRSPSSCATRRCATWAPRRTRSGTPSRGASADEISEIKRAYRRADRPPPRPRLPRRPVGRRPQAGAEARRHRRRRRLRELPSARR